MSGMLLCLDREQRLAFIVGAIFGVSDTVAADVLEISPDNFRQRLARARRELRNFMNDKCGLVNAVLSNRVSSYSWRRAITPTMGSRT